MAKTVAYHKGPMEGKAMATKNIISPFQGEPYTHSTVDEDGNPAMVVRICEMTPEGVISAEGWSSFCVCIFFVFNFFILAAIGAPFLLWIIGLITPFVSHSRILEYYYREKAISTEALFTPTEFRVKTDGVWQVYDRTLTHRFMMMKHDLGIKEREKNDYDERCAQKRGHIIQSKRYYGDSFHIIFDYLGQRNDVATVYDQKRATAVATRLKACDKVMDTKNNMGEGEVLNPGQQWGKAPGTLPGI
jgi:hypothetical protein